MNPKRCLKCLVHGVSTSHPPHDCERADCDCRKCYLIERRRYVANKLVKLGRKQKIDLGIEGDVDLRYTCSQCRHHGVIVIKKHHSPCPYSLCDCELCTLNAERRQIDSEMNVLNRLDNSPVSSSVHSDSDTEESSTRSPEANCKVIIDLINALITNSFDPENFDFAALSNFFSQPTILVPAEWAPMMGEIISLVRMSLQRFPQFEGIDFSTATQEHHQRHDVMTGAESDSWMDCTDTPMSQEAELILELVKSLANASFDPENFDYAALSNFFSQPTILVPEKWGPYMGEIMSLVEMSLKKFPRLEGIDFRNAIQG